MDHGDPNHRFTRPGEVLVIFTQTAVAVEPPQGPLDNPPFRTHGKPLGALGPFDNLQAYGVMQPQRPDPCDQLARIRLIGPDHPQTRELVPENCQQGLGPVTILHTRRGDDDGQDQPERVDEEMPLAALDLFVRIKAADPPFSVVFTDWLSMSPAVGWRRLPAAARTSPRNRSCISGQIPS
jgi:hypothetical protein